MNRPRDTQRLRVYRAEWATLPGGVNLFGTNRAAQSWVDDLVGQPWFTARWPGLAGLVVRTGRGANGSSGFGLITLGPRARNPATALHEVAHEIVSRSPGGGSIYADHGPEWAGVFLFLVGRVMDAALADRLRAAFDAGRVRTAPPGCLTEPLTPRRGQP